MDLSTYNNLLGRSARIELPAEIKNQMRLWRRGLDSLPRSYIDFHLALATKALEVLKMQGYIVHWQKESDDGWMDGMRVLWAEVERNGAKAMIHWHDGNQEFFVKHALGGSSPLILEYK